MKIKLAFGVVALTLLFGCVQSENKRIDIADDVYLVKLSDKAYVHVSVADIGSYKNVSSNGLVLVNKGEAFLFDTPINDEQTKTLVEGISNNLHVRVTKFLAGHWHGDCIGGLNYLHSIGVESYAEEQTIALARAAGLPVPQNGFKDSMIFDFHGVEVDSYFLGAGHSMDNIVVWVPSEKILFGGCLIKDIHSKSLGNVADGDVKEWPKTIEKILHKFPNAKIVIPGHGEFGGLELVRHTAKLLEEQGR